MSVWLMRNLFIKTLIQPLKQNECKQNECYKCLSGTKVVRIRPSDSSSRQTGLLVYGILIFDVKITC